MLGKRIINTGAGAACTTDTVQILDGTPFDSIATYELESDASNSIKSGYIGNGAIFNGSSSYVDTGISSLSGAFSVSLWINEISLSSGSVFGNWNSTSADDIYIRTNSSGQLRLGVDGISNQFFGSSGDISVNTWHHIVMTFNNGTVEAYLDGDSLGTSTTSNTSFSSGLNFVIGADSTKSNASHFNGTIDEVRIYNTALTAGNVATLYAETASSTISISGLQAHYKFEGDATDETGNYDGTAYIVTYNEYDGTASNVTYATGKFGNAAVFNGSSSYIDTTYTVPAVSTQSISVWFKTTSTGSYRTIFSDAPSNGAAVNTRMQIYTTPTSTYDIIIGNNSSYWIGTGSSISSYIDGNWHNIIATYNGTDVKVYIDGSLFQSFTSTISFGTAGNQSLVLGKAGLNNVNYWNGSLDQVRIYDKAISAADVATLYAETLATSQTNISLNAPSGVAYYKMNDATDETGSYDGTATNVNFNVAGKFGNAGEFNGSSYITTSLDFDTLTDYSISMWVYIPATLSDNTFFAGTIANSSALNGIYFLINTDNTIRWFERNASTSITPITSTDTITVGGWNHIVGVRNGGTNYLYVNNGTSVSASNAAITHSTNFTFGRSGAYTTRPLNGKLDQVRIFDRAITSDEVTTLYDEVYCQPTIVPTDYFEPVLYTGNGTDITVNTGLKPDMVWIKERTSTSSHRIVDSVRGDKKRIFTNVTNAESEVAAGEVLLDNGFQVGADNGSNQNGEDYVSWNWKAGGAEVTDTSGTITSQVSASTEAGFSIVKYTGNDVSGNISVGHGLSQAPELVIRKKINGTGGWAALTTVIDGSNDFLFLNTTAAKGNASQPPSTQDVFYITKDQYTNENSSSDSHINYCFHSVEGMSKVGSYTGTGASGNSIVTGFRPAFVMIKVTNDSASWGLFDNKRGGDLMLRADATSADANGNNSVSFASNGFTLPETGLTTNASGKNYIYLAIAEENTQPEPKLANSFNVVTYTGNGSTQSITGLGFQPDLLWVKNRDQPDNHRLVDSIRGATNYIIPNLTNTQTNSSANFSSLDSDGFTVGTALSTNTNNEDYVAWAWKASNDSTINNDGSISSVVSANPASGFSVVKWTGNGVSGSTIGHGLNDNPELIITKGLSNPTSWVIGIGGISGFGVNDYLTFTTAAKGSSSTFYQSYGDSTFKVGVSSANEMNKNNSNEYISYAFHSVDGYQKVGSYTGNNTSREVDTGFQPRFVMVKRTNAVGNWEIWDSLRNPSADNNNNDTLFANSNAAEADAGAGRYMSFDVDGFTISGDSGNSNASGSTYIYLAIA